jgi:hypothetical protein
MVLCIGALSTRAQDENQPAPKASFRSVPIATPTYPYNPYSYPSLYPNYLSGAADVISSQGQLMVDQQQAFLGREQVRSAKIDNRRKALDEYLYERAVTPTTEDERERQRIENVRRSRNDPTPTEIWSARSLNDLLGAIQKQQAQRIEGPAIPVDGQVLQRINMTGGMSDSSLGQIRDGGRVHWPLGLAGDEFQSTRSEIDGLCAQAFQQVQSGAVSPATIQKLIRATDALSSKLRQNVAEISPNDYIAARRFVSDMNGTIRALSDPNVAGNSAPRWPPSGTTVSEMTQQMTRQGLRFAPAVPGDEAAYTALHRAMVAYYSPQSAQNWDPQAK